MKKMKMSLTIVMITVVIVTIMGCGNAKSTNGTEGSPANRASSTPSIPSGETAANEEPVKIVLLTQGDHAAEAFIPEDRIITEINKRLNIDLKIKLVPQAGGAEKIAVALATGDLPDIVSTPLPNAALNQWIDEGLLVPLDDYLNDLPTVKDKLSIQPWAKVNNKYYGYYTYINKSTANVIYRQDWLDTLQLKQPETLDELYDTIKAITLNDPDRNGQNDTYGFSLAGKVITSVNNPFNFIFYANGLPHGDWILDDQNHIAPIFEHPAYKQGLLYIQKLWNEKLIDPEFQLNDSQLLEQKFYEGKFGISVHYLFRHLNRIETSLQKVNPAGKLGFSAPPAGAEGKRGIAAAPKAGGLFTAVTTNAKDPKRAAEVIEFLVSQEGRDLLQLGIEGIHYTKSGDVITYNEVERKADGFSANGWSHPLAWGSVAWPISENYVPQSEPQYEKARESVEIATANYVPNLVSIRTREEDEIGGVLEEVFVGYFNDIITGKRDVDAGLAELSKKWRSQGGDTVLNAVQKVYEGQLK